MIDMQSFYWGTGMIAGFAAEPLLGPSTPFFYTGGPGTMFTRGEQVSE